MEITGPMTARLYAATDARDTDWYVMLLNVFPDGRAGRIPAWREFLVTNRTSFPNSK